MVLNLIAKRAHDLRAGNVARVMHSLPARAPAMHRLQRPVRLLREHRSQVLKPCKRLRRLLDKSQYKIGIVREMPAADNIQVMPVRAVGIQLARRLDTSLGHHRICIAQTEFGRDNYLRSHTRRRQSRAAASSAAADHKHVGLMVDVAEVDILRIQTASRLECIDNLRTDRVSLRHPDPDFSAAVVLEIRMIFSQTCVALLKAQGGNLDALALALDTLGTGILYGFDKFL